MLDTRLIIVEGVMGSGKSTLSQAIARQLRLYQFPAKHVPESFRVHPTSVTRTLTHWQKPWIEHTSESFIAQSQQNWQSFVDSACQTRTVYVFDGQFFHGDMTSLFIANTPRAQIVAYIQRLIEISAPLQPVFIYLYQADVAWGLERTVAVRSKNWLRRQVTWKVDSPYCAEHHYEGVVGWIQLYRDYRTLTDELYRLVPEPKRSIENSAGAWEQDQRQVFAFLELGPTRNNSLHS